MNVSRTVRAAAVAAIAVVGLSACASTPPAQRVALDVVDGLDADESVKACMRDHINELTQDQFQQMAEMADANDLAGQAELTRLENRLAACNS